MILENRIVVRQQISSAAESHDLNAEHYRPGLRKRKRLQTCGWCGEMTLRSNLRGATWTRTRVGALARVSDSCSLDLCVAEVRSVSRGLFPAAFYASSLLSIISAVQHFSLISVSVLSVIKISCFAGSDQNTQSFCTLFNWEWLTWLSAVVLREKWPSLPVLQGSLPPFKVCWQHRTLMQHIVGIPSLRATPCRIFLLLPLSTSLFRWSSAGLTFVHLLPRVRFFPR